jgi:ABC-2 type transport system permease protein
MNQSIEASQLEARGTPLAESTRREWLTLLTLVRREFWEHRILWIAPLAVSALLLVGAAFGSGELVRAIPEGRLVLTPQMIRGIFAVSMLSLGFVQNVVMSVVLWYYAGDCLNAERRDRSILFWKSMPVSDGQTVLAKALVALVVVPIGVYLVTAVTTVLYSGIWSTWRWSGHPAPFLWDTSTWFELEGVSFIGLVIAMLWYAPVTAYLMFLSALVRRNVQLWVFLPPIVGIIVEQRAFGTHYLWNVIRYRLFSGWQSGIVEYVQQLFTGHGASTPDAATLAPNTSPNPLILIHPAQAFGNVDLWIGLAVAVALLFAAARVRRYRDET